MSQILLSPLAVIEYLFWLASKSNFFVLFEE